MIYQTMRRHIAEDGTSHSHRCENLRSRTKGSDWYDLVSYNRTAGDDTKMDLTRTEYESVRWL
jgi:hypothetical protein